MAPKIITDAYLAVSKLTLTGLNAVAQGLAPAPEQGWPKDEPVLALHIKSAREMLACGDKPSVVEINGRLEGPLVQKTELSGDARFHITTALGPPAAAQPQHRLPEVKDGQ